MSQKGMATQNPDWAKPSRGMTGQKAQAFHSSLGRLGLPKDRKPKRKAKR